MAAKQQNIVVVHKFIATLGPRNYQHVGYEFCLLDYPFEVFDFLPRTVQVFFSLSSLSNNKK
jgi:hypothetical protein